MTRLPAVFLHGSGRSGAAAWPAQRVLAEQRECLFLDRLAAGDPPETVVAHVAGRLAGPVHVVAHSYGAISALLLAERRPELVASLALAEPAVLALSRHLPRTRAHVAALEPVLAADVPARELSRRYAAASGTPAPAVSDDALEELVAHLRAVVPPWRVPVRAAVVERVPTLVALGGPDSPFAEVAAVLAEHGAEVLTVPGTGHRPHDGEAFAAAVAALWAGAEGDAGQ